MSTFFVVWLGSALLVSAVLWVAGVENGWLSATAALLGMPLLFGLYVAGMIRGYRFPLPPQLTTLTVAECTLARHRDYPAWNTALQQRGYRSIGLAAMAFGKLCVHMDIRCHEQAKTIFLLWHHPHNPRLYAKLVMEKKGGGSIGIAAMSDMLMLPDPQETVCYLFAPVDIVQMEACLKTCAADSEPAGDVPVDLDGFAQLLARENRRVAEYYIGQGYLHPSAKGLTAQRGGVYDAPRNIDDGGLRLTWRGVLHFWHYVPPFVWNLYRRAQAQGADVLRRSLP